MKSFVSLLSFVLCLSLCLSFALAKDIFVSPHHAKAADVQGCGCALKPCATIRFAIQEALDGDSIVLQGARPFQLTSTLAFNDANKKLRLTALPARAQRRPGTAQLAQVPQKLAVLDCRGLKNNHMAISVGQGVSLTLQNIVIENCHSHSSAALGAFLPAELVLEKVIFKNNRRVRGSGAALSVFGGKVIIRSSTFENNVALSGSGGAISCTHGCNLVLEDSLISNNEAKVSAGGIFLTHSSNLVAEKVIVESNKANIAAGLHSTVGGSVSLQEVDFESNTAEETCSQLLIHAPNDQAIAFVRTAFVSSNSTSEESGFEEGVCLDGLTGGARFEETIFEGLGLSCARSQFVFQDSVRYEAQRLDDERVLPPVACKDSCLGWAGEEKLCKL